jgi:D-alanyl-D-alanine carboxypeptidase
MNPRTRPAAAAAVLVALAVTAGACGSISREVARDRKIDADVAAVNATGVPGVSILVRQGGSTNKVASGVGDVATKVPVKVDDEFRIGSVSKSFVAVVVLQLGQEHKLSLEDPVARWLPGLVPNGDKITVRMLLNHTSGIANYEEHPDYLAPYLKGDLGHVTTPAQLVRMGTSQGPLFAPGTSSAYSNTNYTVAGLIVEKVTGTTLGDQLAQRIFGPLKLRSTSLPTQPEITGPHAHGYFVLGQPPATDVTTFSPSIGWAGGGIVSTTEDVTAFYQALLGGRLLEPAMLAEMMTVVPGANGEMYGLGLAQRVLPCGTVWGHGGNFPGYLMESYSNAAGDHQVTVAYNLDPNSMQPPSVDAVKQLLVDAYCG